MTDDIARLADRYFAYLARSFPVMCASDEFHFLPRAQAAADYYDLLDDLGSKAIARIVAQLKDFRDEIAGFADQVDRLEDRIDLELLQANIAGVLIELDQKRSWQYNPLLYLKIAFIGLDHALNKPAAGRKVRIDRFIARLAAIPGLLEQAAVNIQSIPFTYSQAARFMLEECRQHLDLTGSRLLAELNGKAAGSLTTHLNHSRAALQRLGDHWRGLPVVPDGQFAADTLDETLRNHFLNQRSIDDIYQLAVQEWEQILDKLKQLQQKLNPAASWQSLYHNYLPVEVEKHDTLALYRREISRLRHFFHRQGFSPAELNRPVEISETPHYLKSVRGAASFAAAFTADEREKSYFYITTQLAGSSTDQAASLLRRRFHREFKMLTAHGTIPGHHYLDSIRCRLQNPVRRQIESALFYEGWASYAEFLLVDAGYVYHPMDLLVDYKRRLWRSARCQVDVGLATGRLDIPKALGLLEECGFSAEEARRQIDRFRLNPGYQLCYSLGCHEFRQVKASCGGHLTDADFHIFVLEGGELPFHLIRERLMALGNKCVSS